MKYIPIVAAAVAGLALSGCTLSPKVAAFFGTNDPCSAGAVVHAGFATVLATQPNLAKYEKAERAAYAAFKAQCSDGDLGKATLAKSLDAYSSAVSEWKK